jgi:ribosomal protein S18 acetylase RimI-like enzyme
LYNFGIWKDYQCKGYGKSMLSHLINKYGDKNIILFVSRENKIAIDLYLKNGFLVSNDFVPSKNEICMKRPFN